MRTAARDYPDPRARSKAEPTAPKVSMLEALGFARLDCQKALDAAGGDVNSAANSLLASRILGD